MISCATAQAAGVQTQAHHTPTLVKPVAPLQVTCWQEGEKVIDENNLYNMSINTQLTDEVMSFAQDQDGPANVMVLTMGRSLCLVKGEPQGRQ